ncbi:hypothetical protein [Acrocarpospora catenulata]|uniref:hypothetical protein n=1 Tax=Acrocarpospora catenulata TaxID=2836182 RepID=UPI001BDA4AE6|nr:hypothetical protein [Acrocarpospora catenulata]
MTEIRFVDQTLRDGQQSLWGLRMRAYQAMPVLENIDRTGFHAVDMTGAGMFAVLMRTFRDDPWETVDHLARGLRNSHLRTATRTISVGGMGFAPDSVVDLWITCMARHGIDSFWILDCLLDLPRMRRIADVVTAAGAAPVPAVMYGLTDVHTDEWFAVRAAEMARWPGVEAVYVEDAAGILTPERARTLLPALVRAVDGVPIELHCHTNTGLAPQVYLEGVRAGIDILHTASRPLANGPSLPSTEATVDNIVALGHTHALDSTRFDPVAERLEHEARTAGYEIGAPSEYSVRPFDHQLPGGMTGSLKSQLAQYGMEDRLDEVLAEIPRVRRELGHPIMATPFSQIVGIQAVCNVVTGRRYEVIPDEVVHYALGHYGPVAGVLDPEVADRVLESPRGRRLANWERPQPTLRELRAQLGATLTDDELLLRALFSAEEVDAVKAAGPVPTTSPTSLARVVDQLAQVSGVRARAVSISGSGYQITLRRGTTS